MDNFMNRPIASPWALPSCHCSLMSSWDPLKKLWFTCEGKMPSFYKKYVEDTLTIMPDTPSAASFLQVLNNCHSSVKFTMETEGNGLLPFLGMQHLNRAPQIEIKVYIKPSNTGLLLHYQSHVDMR